MNHDSGWTTVTTTGPHQGSGNGRPFHQPGDPEPPDRTGDVHDDCPGEAEPVGRPRAGTSLEQLPILLTIAEAAQVLRVSRTTAYELAERFRATGGAVGLPVVCLGRQLRVPRAALMQLVSVVVPPDVRSRSGPALSRRWPR